MSLESEYKIWLGQTFAGQNIGQVQINAMRDAFFAGALSGYHMDAVAVFDEVRRHVDSIQPERN